jgi:hypothetical protein
LRLEAGKKLGPYEIVGPVGAGGMGEVYRARDGRLGRDVAVKVLPESLAANADLALRFEKEARAAGGLSHPNVLAVHDVGREGGVAYLVAELLEGQTLRGRLEEGPIPARKVVEIARQLVAGLAAAHDKQIVHRDLKPENVFLTKDGVVKILDFGLAKLNAPVESTDTLPGGDEGTQPGAVMGTAGYMAPEQVQGRAVDTRADIFAFGAILYELATGKRAFRGATPADTALSVLRDEPAAATLPAGLDRIVAHCLEKKPADRFQSARDLAFAIDALTNLTTTSAPAAPPTSRRSILPALAALGVVAAVAVLTFGLARRGRGLARSTPAPAPEFRQIARERHQIGSARFVPGGDSILYTVVSKRSAGETYLESGGITRHVFAGTVAAVRSADDVLVVEEASVLARVTLAGVARPLAEHNDCIFACADYGPDGLAVLHYNENGQTLEYPPGKTITGQFAGIRFGPGGRAALLETAIYADDGGTIDVLEDGKVRVLTPPFSSIRGLAWSPDGREIWFAGAQEGTRHDLWAVSLDRHLRRIASWPADADLFDVRADGAVLLDSREHDNSFTIVNPKATTSVSYGMGWPVLRDVAPDGSFVIGEDESTRTYRVFLQRPGEPPTILGDGYQAHISPDGTQLAATSNVDKSRLTIMPIGAGMPRELDAGGLEERDYPYWLDATRVVFNGRRGGSWAIYVQDASGDGPPRAISPDGKRLFTEFDPVLGDEDHVAGLDAKLISIYSASGLPPVPMPMPPGNSSPIEPVRFFGIGATVFRDLKTGDLFREPVLGLLFPIGKIPSIPDAESDHVVAGDHGDIWAWQVASSTSSLFLATGIH